MYTNEGAFWQKQKPKKQNKNKQKTRTKQRCSSFQSKVMIMNVWKLAKLKFLMQNISSYDQLKVEFC